MPQAQTLPHSQATSKIKSKASEDKHRKASIELAFLNLLFLLIFWGVESIIAERHWLTTLFTYIPQHLFLIPTAYLAVRAAFRREWKALSINIVATIFFALTFLGFNIPLRLSTPQKGTPVRVMSYNILRGSAGAPRIVNVVQQMQPDVLCLQEANGRGFDLVAEMKQLLPGWQVAHHGEVATFSRYPIISQRIHPLQKETERVLLETQLLVKGQPLTVFNVHLTTINTSRGDADDPAFSNMQPSNTRRSEQIKLLQRVTEQATSPLLVAGDFNTPPRGLFYRRLTRRFQDAFTTAGWGSGYTFPAARPLLRIDHIFTSRDIAVRNCFVPSADTSDHNPIVADLLLAP